MKRPYILLADDEPDISEIVKARLELAGYEVGLAADGAEALEKVKQRRPDVMLLDIMMPDVDGYEVCRTLRSDERNKDLPIIMFSVCTGTRDIETARRLGATDYVGKPFEQKELLKKIKTHLNHAGKSGSGGGA